MASSTNAQLNTLLARLEIVEYCRVAPVAVWALDYLLTLDDEVEIIWEAKRWSYIHGIFFVVRYLPPASFISASIYTFLHLSTDSCFRLYKALGGVSLILMIMTEGVLCIRTRALWNLSSVVKTILIVLYTVVCTVVTICMALGMSLGLDGVCSTSSESASSIATAGREERIMAGAFSAIAVFEFAIVCFTLLHACMTFGIRSSSRLMASLYEGNLIYSSTLLALSIANVAFYGTPVTEGWTGLLSM
ncbi:hypothetical protein CONPUDRAFT_154139 [Coniophora puteana RWD-64-598 SS2]|uniref:DUF6533 domain-containing protein n=1 Tax=Coniophora puteana (strain RWD-64-598) TaxID=741705 RepID=A0A5M3MQZ2_CONPW|nr:uncharacterized protein CONPUDRAFT_154139 [Coniophora puteana RWD-64-598 SS2]EIW81608.1 hypothetical protein CONPUDRAFT_154139 [Coniophora puteana RWD-64-598 SS2]